MKLIMFCVATIGISLTSCSQHIAPGKVPSVVKNAVQAKHPAATNVDWEKHNDLYEAEFAVDSQEVTMRVDAAGKIIMQKQDVTPNELPAPVFAVISGQYKAYVLDDAEKIEKNGTIYYQVELDGTRKKDVLLVLDANGRVQSDMPYWD